ncbi:MAG: hypothetical protein [Bacteriophage sp.]|nr:MAG: hypothetical protein [Bacteriophage sp.]UVX73215.1 MAG: hypothetical protein [Bacteriophage sp.]
MKALNVNNHFVDGKPYYTGKEN